jgi:hypothetical protein
MFSIPFVGIGVVGHNQFCVRNAEFWSENTRSGDGWRMHNGSPRLNWQIGPQTGAKVKQMGAKRDFGGHTKAPHPTVTDAVLVRRLVG